MKKLMIFALAVAVLPLVALAGSPDAPEASVEKAIEIAEAPVTAVESPTTPVFETDSIFEDLVFQSGSGGQCIDSGISCGSSSDCDDVCTLPCVCHGTCQYCG